MVRQMWRKVGDFFDNIRWYLGLGMSLFGCYFLWTADPGPFAFQFYRSYLSSFLPEMARKTVELTATVSLRVLAVILLWFRVAKVSKMIGGFLYHLIYKREQAIATPMQIQYHSDSPSASLTLSTSESRSPLPSFKSSKTEKRRSKTTEEKTSTSKASPNSERTPHSFR
jgi:hypothetical protein